MPILGNNLNFSQYEAQNVVVHNGNPNPPSGAKKGQLFFNNSANELYYWDGTIWQSAKSGAGSSGPPSGPAGGDLTGTYPNPLLGAGKILDSHINGSAAIAESKLALASDAAAATPSRRTLGTGATQAMPGNAVITPPDATTGVKGIVQLAGDLAGTAASPQIAAGVITDAEVAAANKDGAVGTYSMRRLGMGATQAMPGDTPLNLVSVAASTVSLNNQRIMALADPSAATDAANKQYVDNAAQGLDAKASVRVVATGVVGAGNSAPGGPQTIDGVAVADGNRVLIAGQTSAQYNGIYTVVTGGSWSRTADANTWAELPSAYVFVEEGTANADTGWVCTANSGGTLDTTALPWVQFSGAGQITAGLGLTKAGNTLDAQVDSSTIEIVADIFRVKDAGITNGKLADSAVDLSQAGSGAGKETVGILPITNGGTGGGTAPVARGNLSAAGHFMAVGPPSNGATWDVTPGSADTTGLMVQVVDVASKTVELPDITFGTPAANQIRITWGASVLANSKRAVVVGMIDPTGP